MKIIKNYQKICVIDFLPLKVRLNIEDKFRINLFNIAINKCGNKVEDLANKFGFSKDYVNRCRRGYTRPTLESLVKITKYLSNNLLSIWDKIEKIGIHCGKEYFTVPYFITLNEEFAWFLGL